MGFEPGDQAQIVITLQCDKYPTCSVLASATSLDTSTEVHVQATIDVTTDSALFGAFPSFREDGSRAPAPAFGKARVSGCLFDNHLIDNSAERIVRGSPGRITIRPGTIRTGSFTLISKS